MPLHRRLATGLLLQRLWFNFKVIYGTYGGKIGSGVGFPLRTLV